MDLKIRPGTIFIQDQEEKQSYEEGFDDDLNDDDDDSDSNNPHNIMSDDFAGLLEAEEETKEETVLAFKNKELQKICTSLAETNRRLIKRIAALEDDQEAERRQEVFVDEYSELNNQFTEVETLIKDYRNELSSFQAEVLQDLKSKDESISKLKEQIAVLSGKNEELRLERDDIEKLNRQLQTRNEGLILQMENLEQEKLQIEDQLNCSRAVRPNRNRHYDSTMQDDLSSEIQTEYEQLIGQLVSELEYERSMKKKMSDEVKRLSEELHLSEKQIMQKNRKLYEVEMKLLRSSKATTHESSIHHQHRHDRSRLPLRPPKQNPLFKSFSLLELINGEVETVSPQIRKTIGLKVTELYQRKLRKRDFSNVMSENLVVTNFTPDRPELLMVRKSGTSAYEKGEKSEESLVWNLAFILDNLFGMEEQGEFDQILEKTGQLLEKQMANDHESLLSLKRLLE